MLKKAEAYYILNNLYCSEQVFEIDSLLLGEPFLENECIVYKSKDAVTIVLYPINTKKYKADYFLKYWKLLASRSIKRIDILGNNTLIPKLSASSTLVSTRLKKVFTNEFILSESSATKKALKAYNSALNKGYRIESMESKGFFDVQVQKLWQSFLKSKSRELSSSDYKYYSSFPVFFGHVDIEVLVVKKQLKTIGCCFLYHATETKKVVLLCVHSSGHGHVTDFVFGELVTQYPSSNFYLGPSTDSGVKIFKQKWATEIDLPQYEQSYNLAPEGRANIDGRRRAKSAKSVSRV